MSNKYVSLPEVANPQQIKIRITADGSGKTMRKKESPMQRRLAPALFIFIGFMTIVIYNTMRFSDGHGLDIPSLGLGSMISGTFLLLVDVLNAVEARIPREAPLAGRGEKMNFRKIP